MPDEDSDLIEQALEQWRQSRDAESVWRDACLQDQKFSYANSDNGFAWDPAVKNQRAADGRPCLTINILDASIRQVVNELRQNRPAIRCDPVDAGADVETAKIIDGLFRHIQVNSDADIAYDTAGDNATRVGIGWTRVKTDWCDSQSMDQEVLICRVENPFMVYIDPNASEPDRCDMRYAFLAKDLTWEEYKRAYPQSSLGAGNRIGASLEIMQSVGDARKEWITPRGIRIAEWFRVVEKPIILAQLADGRCVDAASLPPGAPIVAQRKSVKKTVEWRNINAMEVLERGVFPGERIPLVPEFGDEYLIDNQRYYSGLVRNSKDAQRGYNFMASYEAESISLAPRAPIMAAEGQIEDYEDTYRDANRKNFAVLPYRPQSLDGHLVPPPQRQVLEPPIQAVSQARQQAYEDVKRTTGMFAASLGDQGGENSGKAIMARQREGDVATFHYADNQNRTIRSLGKLILPILPVVYPRPRVARIIGEDGQASQAMIYNSQAGYAAPQQLPKGIDKIYDLGVGRYDVVMESGPSFATKRQEAQDAELQTMKILPPDMAAVMAVDFVRNSDWPGSTDMADRLERVLPPNLQPPKKDQEPIPQQAQQQIQQMGQMIDALTKQLHSAMDTIDQKQVEANAKKEIETMKVSLEKYKADLQALTAHEQLTSEENMLQIEHRLKAAIEADRMQLEAKISAASAQQQAELNPQPTEPAGPVAQ